MSPGYVVSGVRGRGDPPRTAGNFRGPLAVVACGRCVWADLKRLDDLSGGLWPWDIMCVNDVGIYLPRPYQHLTSMHSERLPLILAVRRRRIGGADLGGNNHVWTHGPADPPGADNVWDFEAGGGTSTLFALRVATCLGYGKMILCGAPLDDSGHFWSPPADLGLWQPKAFPRMNDFNTRTLEIEWRQAAEWMGGRVRSMSGRTAEWLGAPDERWINV